MLPGTLSPLDSHKTRALTTIYAPRKHKPRKHKTAQTRMLEKDLPVKSTLSPFHPLPAIGKKQEKTKVIVIDLKSEDRALKLQEVLKPLTPLSIRYLRNNTECASERKPRKLLRENTYEVIEPIYLNADKVKKRDTPRTEMQNEAEAAKMSPKSRFKNAAMQVAKLTSKPETGKLLCLREKETYNVYKEDTFRLQKLPQSPVQELNKLTEIFQSLDMRGRHRDKMKKENSWF